MYLAKLEKVYNFVFEKNYNCLEIGCGDALNTFIMLAKLKKILATDNSEKLV